MSLKEKTSQSKKVEDSESTDSECEAVSELPKIINNPANKPKARQSVSAEAFGKYHVAETYEVKVVPKSEAIK